MARGRKKGPIEHVGSNWYARKRAAQAESDIGAELPEVPDWLNEAERKIFTELAITLAKWNLVSSVSSIPLGMLARSLHRFTEANAVVEREGMVITDKDGNQRAHPATRRAAQAWQECFKLLREFGLTPASKSSVSTYAAKKAGAVDHKEDYFKRQ